MRYISDHDFEYIIGNDCFSINMGICRYTPEYMTETVQRAERELLILELEYLQFDDYENDTKCLKIPKLRSSWYERYGKIDPFQTSVARQLSLTGLL